MKSLLKIFTLCVLSMSVFGQSVTILPSGITPAIASSIPTLTIDQIEAIPSPGFGSLVNDATFKCFRFYDGKGWAKLLTNRDSNPASIKAWSEGGANHEVGKGIAVDANGNIFVSGTFYDSSKFGNKVILSQGGTDIFLAKYDKNGTLIWVRTGGGSSNDDGAGKLSVDKNGNVYLTGSFSGTATFGDVNVTSTGGIDFFITKYNTNGEIEWLQKAGGTGLVHSGGIVTDTNGDVYVSGEFTGKAFFNAQSVTTAGEQDIFLAKFTSAGVLQWVTKAGGTSKDTSGGLAVDSNGDVYVTGSFLSTISFGTTSLTNSGEADGFVAKYTPSNNTWAWAKKAGGTKYDGCTDVAVSADGNVFVAGYFEDVCFLFGVEGMRSRGERDIFLAKFSSDGAAEWVKREGGEVSENIPRIGIDTNNNIYLCGYLNGSSISNIGSNAFSCNGDGDILIAKFDSNGINEWAQKLGDTSSETPYAMTVGAKGNIYITGEFTKQTQFGNDRLISAGGYELFVVRIKE